MLLLTAHDSPHLLSATPAAQRAMQTGVNLADPTRQSCTYESRLAKYAQRGFAVGVPGLRTEAMRDKYTRGLFVRYEGRLVPRRARVPPH